MRPGHGVKSKERKTSCFRNSSHLPRVNFPPTPPHFQVFPAASNLLSATRATCEELGRDTCQRAIAAGTLTPSRVDEARPHAGPRFGGERTKTGAVRARPPPVRLARPRAQRRGRGGGPRRTGSAWREAHLDATGRASSGPGSLTLVSRQRDRGTPDPLPQVPSGSAAPQLGAPRSLSVPS